MTAWVWASVSPSAASACLAWAAAKVPRRRAPQVAVAFKPAVQTLLSALGVPRVLRTAAASTGAGPARRRLRIPPDAGAALLLLAGALAFYYPLVFLGRALVDYDAFVYFYPQRAYLARSLLQWQLPLWNPYLFLGAPFLANPQTAVLYPPSWLFVVGPMHVAYAVQLVLHAWLAAFFTYLFARHALGVLPLAAGIGGLAYAVAGFTVGQVGHLNQLSAAAWLPAVLLAYDRFARGWTLGRTCWIGLGALAFALQILAGHPQETYMTLIVLGVFGVVRAPWRSPWRLAWAALGGAGMCLLGAAVAAAQLLPTLELAPLSIRGEGVNWRDAVAGSLPSYLAVRALFPPFWIDAPYPEYLGYVGVVPLTLGLLALLLGTGRSVLFGSLVCAIGLVLALGDNSGFYGLAFAWAPGFDTFRVPARWLLVWQFGAASLAAVGADWVGRGARVCLRVRSVWARLVLVAFVIAIGLAWQQQQGEPFAQRRTPLVWGALAALTLAIGGLPHLRRPHLAVALLAGLTGAELWAAADASPARQAPPPLVRPGESVDWLRASGASEADRVLSLARPEYIPATEGELRSALGPLPERVVQSLLIAQKWRDTLTPNVPLQFGLATADGYDGGVLPLQRWLELARLLVPAPRPDGVLLSRLQQVPDERLLDLLGVRYLIANRAAVPAGNLGVADLGDLRVFVRDQPVPRSLLVFSATTADDDAAALDRLAKPDFDPNQEVILSAGSVDSQPRGTQLSSAAVAADVLAPVRWHARVSLPADGYLLQRESWYPGWRARVDGVETPVLRADVLFRAVALSAGEHDIEVFFDSPSFNRGVLLSLFGLLVTIVLLGWPWVATWAHRGRRRL